jgi:23S rRNA (uridine2552-2'-O)-methyltransferase
MFNRKDAFYKKAKQEGYKSRAAYKLMEINKKYSLIKKGDIVLDAGAAPGGWSQVALDIIGEKGKVVGVDLLELRGIENNNFTFIQGDLTKKDTLDQVLAICDKYDVVISDAAPNTSGQKFVDHANSIEIVKLIFEFAKKVLKNNGNFLFKLFDGEDREKFIKELKQKFSMVKIIKPDSTRKNSFEIYVVCKGMKR